MTKTFNLKQLFTIVDGRLSTGIEDVYSILNHLCDQELMTHHLPVASDYVKYKNPQWFKLVDSKIEILKNKFGDHFETLMEAIDSGYNENFEVPQLKDEFDGFDFGPFMAENSILLKSLEKKGDSKKTLNLIGRISTVDIEPVAGDHIDDLKDSVKNFCVEFKCKANFSHNGRKFICDREGNIAQTN